MSDYSIDALVGAKEIYIILGIGSVGRGECSLQFDTEMTHRQTALGGHLLAASTWIFTYSVAASFHSL
jgi:hypothetical protein